MSRNYQLADKSFVLKLFLMGFIVFSPLSSFITMDIFHLPISLPEVLFLLFLPFCRKYFRFSSLKRVQTFVLLWVWVILIVLAVLVGRYSLYAILATARSYLYLFLFYLLFCKDNNVSIDVVYYICIGTFCGWLLDAFISFRTVALLVEGVNVSYGPMLCIPILIGVQVLRGKYKTLLLTLFVSVILMILSGMRRQMLITVVVLAVAFIYTMFRNKKIFIQYLVILIGFVGIVFLYYPIIENAIGSYSKKLYYRVVVKTESLITGESNEGDDMRKNFMRDFIEDMDSYILPHGFVSKQTATDRNTGTYNDFPMLELVYTIGLIGAFLLIAYFGYTAYRCYYLINNNLLFVFTLSYIAMFVLLFLEGSFLTFPYAVPFTGYCLGNLQKYSRISVLK